MIALNKSSQLQELDSRIRRIREQIRTLPAGTLNISHQGDNYYYKHRLPGGNVRYIPRENLSLARDLAFRRYLELQLEECTACRQALENYQCAMRKISGKAARYLTENEGVGRLLRNNFPIENAPLAVWAARPQNTEAPHRENRVLSCRSGHVVRSKSESMIDHALFAAQIPFRYEEPLILGQTTLYPDFTVRHPATGAYYYWEHFGMMSDPAYSKAAASKIVVYARHGFIPFHNLILTFESIESPLSDAQIDLMINYYFGV